jgi:predicted nucleic acid-binding protein
MTVGEIGTGIEVTRDQDPVKAKEIETWLATMLAEFEVLALDAPVMRLWARLMHNKSDDLYEDALIAATALVHGLTIVTRNTRDFDGFGAEVMSPFTRQSRG